MQLTISQLFACWQQGIAVPPALVQTAYEFDRSPLRPNWRYRNVVSPGSMAEITFRLVNLQAAISSRQILEPQPIVEAALKIEEDLDTWRAGISSDWRYTIVDAPPAAEDACYGRKVHVYSSLWVAEIWNNWRALRMLVNQLIVQYGTCSSATEGAQGSKAVLNIREMSVDLCVSVFTFTSTPRTFSVLIQR